MIVRRSRLSSVAYVFGTSIGLGGSPGRAMPEAAAMRAGGDVGDDVDLLAGVLEGALEREVVVRRDDELVRRAALAQESREPREEAMERAGLDGRLEARVQLVVQRARALHRRHVLRDPREVDRAVVRNRECPREMLREVPGPVEPDDRDDAASEERLHDLALLVGGHRSAAGRESGLVPEDLRLEPLELRAGLDSEFVDEAGARILVDLQGLRLPARTIQREHELPAEGLAERMVANERLERADDVAVPAELEIGLDPLLERDEPELLEAPDLRLCEVVEGELGECRAAPEGERLLELLAPLRRWQPPRVDERALEPPRVDLVLRDAEHVAGRPRLQHVGAERAP